MQRAFRTGMLFVFKCFANVAKVLELWQLLISTISEVAIKKIKMLHPSFQQQLPIVIGLLKQYKIKNAYVFGSAVTDKFNDKSDVDLLINFQEGIDYLERGELMWNLQFALEDTLHREIDLIQEKSLHKPYFIKELNETKVLIYE